MQLDKITTGDTSRDDINVIIEVPIGGQPIKYECNKDRETAHGEQKAEQQAGQA